MTMPDDVFGTDRHVLLTQIHSVQKRAHWFGSGIRHASATPPVAPVTVKNPNDTVNNEGSDPPKRGESRPHPKIAIFSLVNADRGIGNDAAGNEMFPPSDPMPGEQ